MLIDIYAIVLLIGFFALAWFIGRKDFEYLFKIFFGYWPNKHNHHKRY